MNHRQVCKTISLGVFGRGYLLIAFRKEDFAFGAGLVKLVYWERFLLWEFFYGCKPALQLVVFF